jgi:hypothetical protein
MIQQQMLFVLEVRYMTVFEIMGSNATKTIRKEPRHHLRSTLHLYIPSWGIPGSWGIPWNSLEFSSPIFTLHHL